MIVKVTLPLRTHSANADISQHWRVRRRRAAEQRNACAWTIHRYVASLLDQDGRLWCTLTRIAPRGLDSDNLAGSMKHCRDGIADAMGINDRDETRLEYRYAQRKGGKREYAVEIDIRTKGDTTDEH